ncbi:ATP-binding protein [Hydrogenophaga sp. PAMC20947]|uniref:ATP-binding protein n=1 Tax=Hydrogenophaga sp. PAMC20947 TaxID=2565558 RepID=UPI00109E1A79|nr:ATP-binding protein [Hydrogenophaga sp. PAMC20947]QCB46951.1 ATP-binding protein [Hydrogenophaga sp. PAMC20947]
MTTILRDVEIHLPASHRDNILISACGRPLEPVEIGKRLIYLPPSPGVSVDLPRHQLEHLVADIFRMHIPSAAGIEIAQTIGYMLTQGYVHRNPKNPETWRRIYSAVGTQAAFSPIQLGAMVTGVSGAGKSTAIERALQLFPQVVRHDHVPGFATPSPQLLWLKVDVPASGKIMDLVENLSRATDAALGTSHTEDLFKGRRLKGAALAHQWLQKISCNFLGLLVLDELQNLFSISTKAVRTTAARRQDGQRPMLRIVDDEVLKFLLTLSNFAKIPTLYCSTPDGMTALNTRMSTAQRMLTAGFHTVPHALSADDEFFRKRLFPILCRYQWLPEKLSASDELRRLLFDLSAGVPRMALMAWFHASRRAIQRNANGLSFEDFLHVGANAMGPLRPAVTALLSDDPRRLQRYEDLMVPVHGAS